MRKLIEDGKYFSDHEMNERNPLLYEQMIGQYLTDEEKEDLEKERRANDNQQRPLSSFFMNQLENNQIEKKRSEQAASEYFDFQDDSNQDYMNEVERKKEDEDEDEDEEEEEEERYDVEDDDNDPDNHNKPSISEEDKQELRKNFTYSMYEQFLKGNDIDYFDYNQIDDNDDYDPMDLINQDAEDSYFDSEEAN